MNTVNPREIGAIARLLVIAVPCFTVHSGGAATNSGVELTKLDDRVRVQINGQLFTEYVFKGAAKPYCYPIFSPTGVGMSRDWPMKDTPGEEHDHPHHMGLWFGHQKVNSDNFWTVTTNSGKIVQETLAVADSGSDVASITTQNRWIGKSGVLILADERRLRFYNRAERIMDFEITLKASEGDVTFGDEKDGLIAFRVAETMRVLKPPVKGEKAKAGDGHIVLSTGVTDDGASAATAKDAKLEAQTWGKRAEWCDYYGPVAGKTVGVAIFDHPSNLRHPSWWHVRDYGLLAANPFGQHFFEKDPGVPKGDFKMTKGQSLTFRYRFYFHVGDEKQGHVAERYKEFVHSASGIAK
jgi:hypothetical protein